MTWLPTTFQLAGEGGGSGGTGGGAGAGGGGFDSVMAALVASSEQANSANCPRNAYQNIIPASTGGGSFAQGRAQKSGKKHVDD